MKYRSFARIKPQNLQELLSRILRTLKTKSSKSPFKILKFVGIKLKNLQKLQEVTNRKSSMDSSPKSFEKLPPQTFEDKEHTKNIKNKEFLTSS